MPSTTGWRRWRLLRPARAAAGFVLRKRHLRRRISLTVSAPDTNAIPKVPEAGTVRDHDGTRVQVMHNGVLVEAGRYHGDWMIEVIRRLRGHHEPQEELVFHEIVKRLRADTPDPVMVELGAFWAYYTIWLKRALPAARCLIVEPDPSSLDVGLRNAALNNVSVEWLQAAVGDVDAEAVPIACESDGRVREMPVVSVDGLMNRFRLERIDVLHCDAQGAEVAMLRGAARAMESGSIRFLVVSTHDASISGDPDTHRRCLDALAARDAHVIAEHSVEESASGDGLIVASLDPRDADLVVEVSRVGPERSLFGGLGRRPA